MTTNSSIPIGDYRVDKLALDVVGLIDHAGSEKAFGAERNSFGSELVQGVSRKEREDE